jgi:hypothetical protein
MSRDLLHVIDLPVANQSPTDLQNQSSSPFNRHPANVDPLAMDAKNPGQFEATE